VFLVTDSTVTGFPNRATPLRPHNAGFTLIEVLVATLIMVVSIVTVTAAIRQFAIHREKLSSYQQIYTTVLSLHDRIMNETLKENSKESGTLNGLPYSYDSRLVESANNYIYGDQPGNNGAFQVMLFKVDLTVDGRDYEFFKTQYRKRFETSNDQF
jgi:type II secretory pathway pseudopilin PulG